MACYRFGSARKTLLAYATVACGVIPLVVGVEAAVRVFGSSVPAQAAVPVQRIPSNTVALVIGNANYPDANEPVVQAVNDAQALAASLTSHGVDVDLQQNLTRDGMAQAIRAFMARIHPGVTALVSFGGYGLQVNRENYLMPVDAQIWSEADVVRDGINLNALLADLHARGAAVQVAIIDASRRNPFERRIRRVSTGLATIQAPQSTLILSAMTPGKPVDDTSADHSRVIGEVIEELRSPRVNLETVFNRTRMRVSTGSGGEQVPAVASSLIDDCVL